MLSHNASDKVSLAHQYLIRHDLPNFNSFSNEIKEQALQLFNFADLINSENKLDIKRQKEILLNVILLLPLQKINLAHCMALDKAMLKKILNSSSQLVEINLTGCRALDNDALKLLNKNKTLHTIDLSEIDSLTSLQLELMQLKSFTAKRCLRLACLKIKSQQLETIDLTHCPQLKMLTIEAPKLVYANLQDCENITDTTIADLADNCPSLESMNLQGCNQVSYARMKEVAPAFALLQHDHNQLNHFSLLLENILNHKISKVTLVENGIKKEEVLALSQVLAKKNAVTALDLRHNFFLDDGAIAIAKMLSKKNFLTKVSLNFCGIKEAGIIALAKSLESNYSITDLDLSSNKIDGEGAKAIANAIATNSSLTAICLSGIGASRPSLIILINSLSANLSLKEVDFAMNSIGEDGAKAFSAVLKHSNILKLNLEWCSLVKGSIKVLAEELGENSCLTSLTLAMNKISAASAYQIATFLIKNTTLTELDLSGCSIDSHGATQIAHSLPQNKTLIYLDLSANRIGESGGLQLVKSMTNNTTLARLMLDQNVFGYSVMEELQKTNLDSRVTVNDCSPVMELSNASLGWIAQHMNSAVILNKATLLLKSIPQPLNIEPLEGMAFTENATHKDIKTIQIESNVEEEYSSTAELGCSDLSEEITSHVSYEKTLGDGQCFFHAAFGILKEDTYQAYDAQDMRKAWCHFMKQYQSLKDMPSVLRDFMVPVIATIFDDPSVMPKEFIDNNVIATLHKTVQAKLNRAEKDSAALVKMLLADEVILADHAKNSEKPLTENMLRENLRVYAKIYKSEVYTEEYFNEHLDSVYILNLFIENEAVYQGYIATIINPEYFIFMEEIPILASLSNTTIRVWRLEAKGYFTDVLYEPNHELQALFISPKRKLSWDEVESVEIYHAGFNFDGTSAGNHYSRANSHHLNVKMKPKADIQEPDHDVFIFGQDLAKDIHGLIEEKNVNAKDKQGNTALHLIAKIENPSKQEFELAKLLINNGADLNQTNYHFKTPLDELWVHASQQLLKIFKRPIHEHLANLFLRRRTNVSMDTIESIIADCQSRYVNDFEHQEANERYLDKIASKLARDDVTARMHEHRFKYFGHLNSLKSNCVIGNTGEVIEFEMMNAQVYFSLRIRILLEIIIKASLNILCLPLLQEENMAKLKHELYLTIEILHTRKDSDLILKHEKSKFRSPLIEAQAYTIANKIAQLKESEIYYYHSGFKDHSLYITFEAVNKENKRYILIRIDNLGMACEMHNKKIVPYKEEKTHNKNTRLPYKWLPYVFFLPQEYFIKQMDERPPAYLIDVIEHKFNLEIEVKRIIYKKPIAGDYTMSAEELAELYPWQRGQTVNNCVAKNHFVGIKIRWQSQQSEKKEKHALFRWFRQEELKHIPFKSLSRAFSTLHHVQEDGAVLINEARTLIKDARDHGYNQLHLSIVAGDLAELKSILKVHPTLLLTRTDNGYTALHLASLYGRNQMINFLLDIARVQNKYHHLVEATTEQGNTALELAQTQKLTKTILLLAPDVADKWSSVQEEAKDRIICRLNDENEKLKLENKSLKQKLNYLKTQRQVFSPAALKNKQQPQTQLVSYRRSSLSTLFNQHTTYSVKTLTQHFEKKTNSN